MNAMPAAYICDGLRTPIGRYNGALARVRPDDLAALTIKALLARHKALDPKAIDDVLLGCANQAGEDSRNVARMAALLAGLPDTIPGATVNRLCASGLDAIGQAARAVMSGDADLIVAGGVESMTRAPFVMGKADTAFSRTAKIEDTTIGWRFINPAMVNACGTESMPETAENVAVEFGISRADQDAFAWRSQQRAGAAQARGFFQDELVPVTVPGKAGPMLIDCDEHPRPETTPGGLAKLKPVVRENGTVTAGNASGVNDGAAALIIASEDAARRHGLIPRARILGYATAGVPPRVMGIGPVPATQKLMAKTGLSIQDFDVIELNEAFAAQALAVLHQMGLPDDAGQVNPNGGAIALGHPLGASGARLALTALRALEEKKGRFALATLCVGVGQGAALAMETV
jgi:3-oxoadipyl-CoA thiolase